MKPNRNDFCNWCAYKSACPEFNTLNEVTKKVEELKAIKETSDKNRK